MVSTSPYPAFFIDFTLFSSYPCYTGTAMPSTQERRLFIMDIKPINVRGYDTYYTECIDNSGKYLLIAIPSTATKDISNICNTFLEGHLITMIDYATVDNVRFIKAYY